MSLHKHGGLYPRSRTWRTSFTCDVIGGAARYEEKMRVRGDRGKPVVSGNPDENVSWTVTSFPNKKAVHAVSVGSSQRWTADTISY